LVAMVLHDMNYI